MKNQISFPQFTPRSSRIDCMTISLYANSLWKDRQVLCVFYEHSLVNEKVEHILSLHHKSKHLISIENTLTIIKEISLLPHLPAYIDIGELAANLLDGQPLDRETLVANLWRRHLMQSMPPRDVVLFGFGRIGRMLARELCTDLALSTRLQLKAVVTRDPLDPAYLRKRASLFMKDSIHESFQGSVIIEEHTNCLIINDIRIRFISAQYPQEVDYSSFGIENGLLIDNTGLFRNHEELKIHLQDSAIEKVIVTAPARDVPNIIFGINDQQAYESTSNIFSTASCTTNAITPVLSLIDTSFGIEKGHIETIHAYTNDQNLVDNMHSKSRRGRAAALNMVITETGAGQAVAKALPNLKGKLTSNAIRVPVANGSLAILLLELKKEASLEQIISALELTTRRSHKYQPIALSYDEELVSTDIIGNPAAGIVDMCATRISSDGKSLTLYIWYDNEYGYGMQVLGFASKLFHANAIPSTKSNGMSEEFLAEASTLNN